MHSCSCEKFSKQTGSCLRSSYLRFVSVFRERPLCKEVCDTPALSHVKNYSKNVKSNLVIKTLELLCDTTKCTSEFVSNLSSCSLQIIVSYPSKSLFRCCHHFCFLFLWHSVVWCIATEREAPIIWHIKVRNVSQNYAHSKDMAQDNVVRRRRQQQRRKTMIPLVKRA